MNIRKWLPYFLVVLLLILLVIFALILYSYTDEERTLSSDIFVGAVLFLSIAIAIIAYSQARTNDEYKIAEERRHFYITNPVMRKVRMLVQHNDIVLQTLVLITNIAEVRQPNILSEEALKLRNHFDDYLNYMEGVAILANRGSMFKESIEGLWTYYFKGLRRSHTLDFSEGKIQIDEINKCIDLHCATPEAALHVKNLVASILPEEDKSTEDGRDLEERRFIDRVKDLFTSVLPKKSECTEGVPDPIEKNFIRNGKRNAIIDPVERPIWFYVNNPGYEFVPIITFEKRIYSYDSKLYKDKQEWLEKICLDKDGLEPISLHVHHSTRSLPE